MFRWYSADMTQAEFFRYTPRSVFLYIGGTLLVFYLYTRLMFTSADRGTDDCLEGKMLWWDRQNYRLMFIAGSGHFAPTYGFDY